jgi:hypothetical protein
LTSFRQATNNVASFDNVSVNQAPVLNAISNRTNQDTESKWVYFLNGDSEKGRTFPFSFVA